MRASRMEAFSDGVIAILITVMVLELKMPAKADWTSLSLVKDQFFTYALSFVFLGIYWNNHHHMIQSVEHVNGKVLWANLHLLFWLSLIPYTTEWVGASSFDTIPTALYGTVLLLSAIAYFILVRALLGANGPDSKFAKRLGRDVKGKISPFIYLIAIALAFLQPLLSAALYVLVALIWLIPDPRFERRTVEEQR